MMKVNFYSSTNTENGVIILLTATGRPDLAAALSLQNGMTEEMVKSRVEQAFKTLAAGIARDDEKVA